jgi:hypothetical protein
MIEASRVRSKLDEPVSDLSLLAEWTTMLAAEDLSADTIRTYAYGLFRLLAHHSIRIHLWDMEPAHVAAFLASLGDRSSAKHQYRKGLGFGLRRVETHPFAISWRHAHDDLVAAGRRWSRTSHARRMAPQAACGGLPHEPRTEPRRKACQTSSPRTSCFAILEQRHLREAPSRSRWRDLRARDER